MIKNHLAKHLVLALLLISVSSCSSNDQPKHLNQLPVWYVTPKSSNSINLHGVGEGYILDEASKSALNNLAGKLMVSVSSESSLLMESNKYSTNEQSRQKINEEVSKITFNNYQISNSAAFGGKIYAEISVNRDGFLADYNQKLIALNQKMVDIFSNAQNKTILEKLNDLELVKNLSLEASSIAQILVSLNNQKNFKTELDLYNSYQNSYQNLATKIEFFIEAENTPKTAINALIKAINQKKFKIVKSKNLDNPNLVIIKINSEIVEQKIYGSNIAKLKLNLNLLSNKNKIIKTSFVESSGGSVISKEEAINAAISSITEFNLF